MSEHKKIPLIIVAGDAELTRIDGEMDALGEKLHETVRDLKKQAHEFEEKTYELIKTKWEEVSEYLKLKGLLPTYDKEKQALCIHDGVIFLSEREKEDEEDGVRTSGFTLRGKAADRAKQLLEGLFN